MTDTQIQTIPVRAVVKYIMMGDHPGAQWLPMVLEPAKESGKVDDYKLLYSDYIGGFGMQLVVFSIDIKVADGSFEDAQDRAEALINAIVWDSDAEVLGITSLAGR